MFASNTSAHSATQGGAVSVYRPEARRVSVILHHVAICIFIEVIHTHHLVVHPYKTLLASSISGPVVEHHLHNLLVTSACRVHTDRMAAEATKLKKR